MAKVFTSAPPFNKHTDKYSWDNWNRAVASGDPRDLRILETLVKGNFYAWINTLMDFEPGPETHPWVPKRPHKLNR